MFNKVKKQLLLAMYLAYADRNFVSKAKVLTELNKTVNRLQLNSEMPSSEAIDEALTELERDNFIIAQAAADQTQEPLNELTIKLHPGRPTDLTVRMFEQAESDRWHIPITDDYPSLVLPNKDIAKCYAKKRKDKIAAISTKTV